MLNLSRGANSIGSFWIGTKAAICEACHILYSIYQYFDIGTVNLKSSITPLCITFKGLLKLFVTPHSPTSSC